MNQHSRIAKTPRKASTKAAPTARPQLSKLAQTIKRAGTAVGRTSVKAAKPLVQTFKQEETGTLAKMAVAALAPKLVNAALRFVIRNPLVAAAGVIAFAALATMSDDDEASAKA